MKNILLLFIGLTIFSCQQKPSEAEEIAKIKEASKSFSQYYIDKALHKQMSYYTDDIVNIAGNRPMIIGKEAVTKYWTLPDHVQILEHASIPTKIEVSGENATDYGIYQGKTLRNGDTITFRGQYLITWRKEADGQWRMSADMWNSLN